MTGKASSWLSLASDISSLFLGNIVKGSVDYKQEYIRLSCDLKNFKKFYMLIQCWEQPFKN